MKLGKAGELSTFGPQGIILVAVAMDEIYLLTLK
jgi:hypothetical protein